MRYDQLIPLIDQAKPKTIVEIGTHQGTRAVAMCRRALIYHPDVHYIGYDLFEDATPETDKTEMNGKGHAVMIRTYQAICELKKEFPEFTCQLYRGNTRETLHGKNIIADFVFIDGGHSVDTIRGDYEAVMGSKFIVFDDYYLSGADVSKFGCNEVIKDVPHYLLPKADRFGNVSIKMAVLR